MQSATEIGAKLNASRLGSARRRIRALLNQIEVLESSDFPHTDGEAALSEVKRHFGELLKELDGAELLSLGAIQGLCLKTSVEVELHLPVLGFILRSTNVRNAFEAYDPLKRIVALTVRPGAHLIISSEWDFVPFTYPMSLDVLPNYVLVGGPAHESDSALLIPIAGHEIGHSAWQAHDVISKLDPKYISSIESLVSADEDLRNDLEEDYGPGFAGLLRDLGMKRVEELFCDAFALYLFGDAYYFAFEHLTYPGGTERGSDYPKVEDRVAFLLFAAERRGFPLRTEFADLWRLSSDNPDTDGDIDEVLDKSATSIYSQIADAAAEIIEQSTVDTPSEANIMEACSSFEAGIPVANAVALADLLCAGWRLMRRDDEEGGVDRSKLINELILKSIEVGEFQRRTAHA